MLRILIKHIFNGIVLSFSLLYFLGWIAPFLLSFMIKKVFSQINCEGTSVSSMFISIQKNLLK